MCIKFKILSPSNSLQQTEKLYSNWKKNFIRTISKCTMILIIWWNQKVYPVFYSETDLGHGQCYAHENEYYKCIHYIIYIYEYIHSRKKNKIVISVISMIDNIVGIMCLRHRWYGKSFKFKDIFSLIKIGVNNFLM